MPNVNTETHKSKKKLKGQEKKLKEFSTGMKAKFKVIVALHPN